MPVFAILSISSMLSIFAGTYSAINAFISAYAYIAIIVLMALESASIPIPSEVILPLTGHFIQTGLLNPYLALIATMVGTTIGITIDYLVAYVLGKEVIYKHLRFFHVRKETLVHFDDWFSNNGAFAVSVSRLLPLVRGLISFPAGFARMPLRKFYFYSLLGSLAWNVALIAFGYYALQIQNATILFAVIALFAIVLYIMYHVAIRKIKKEPKRKRD